MIMLIFYSTRCSLPPSFLLPSTTLKVCFFLIYVFSFNYDYLQIDYIYDWAKLQQRPRRVDDSRHHTNRHVTTANALGDGSEQISGREEWSEWMNEGLETRLRLESLVRFFL